MPETVENLDCAIVRAMADAFSLDTIDPSQDSRNVVDGLYAIAKAIGELADAIKGAK